MKNTFKFLAIGGLSAILLAPGFAFSQVQHAKNTRHIRLMKIENGKKMEIDTILSGSDVFVWNGDTISPEKHIKGFSPSEFDKRHPDPMDNNPRRRVHILRGRALHDSLIMQGDSAEEFQIITHEGDTLGQKIFIHKRLRNGDEKDHFIYLDGAHKGHFPPMPPVPPIRRFKHMNTSKMINLNDPNVISFKKKDLSGGREKIEIIRKKTTEAGNMDFTMDEDPQIDVPQPPMIPGMHGENGTRGTMLKEDIKTNQQDKKTERKAARQNK